MLQCENQKDVVLLSGVVPAGHNAALESLFAKVDESAHVDELLDDAISNREVNSIAN